MTLKVRLFAMLRECAGQESIEVEVVDGTTVSELVALLKERQDIGELVDRIPVLVARNRSYADGQDRLCEGDELALIPPVSGGAESECAKESESPKVYVRITDQELKVDGLFARVGTPAAGAVVTFTGTTRDVPHLFYEAYIDMAVEKIEEIVTRVVEDHGLEAAAVEHRVGRVRRGEPSVVIATSAVHREQAFKGAREIIDSIKESAPIWKKEVAGTEEKWVREAGPQS